MRSRQAPPSTSPVLGGGERLPTNTSQPDAAFLHPKSRHFRGRPREGGQLTWGHTAQGRINGFHPQPQI